MEQTNGHLRMFYLPPHSPQLNRAGWAWRHVKNHRVVHQPVSGPVQFPEIVVSALRRLHKLPPTTRASYTHPISAISCDVSVNNARLSNAVTLH